MATNCVPPRARTHPRAANHHAHGHGFGLVALECNVGGHLEERRVLDLTTQPLELVRESPTVLWKELDVLWHATRALDQWHL